MVVLEGFKKGSASVRACFCGLELSFTKGDCLKVSRCSAEVATILCKPSASLVGGGRVAVH
jgi:hypothetical protein